jgi:O-antigen/teichoic acid export membrane protein
MYAAAGFLCRALLFLPAAVCWVALPRFSESRGRGEEARRWLRGAMIVTAGLAAAAFVVMVALRGLFVEVAFGGSFA